MGHGFHRGEQNLGLRVRPAFALKELRHRLVVKNADRAVQDLRGKVEVADFPSDQRGLGGSFQPDFINHLRQLADDVVDSRPDGK